MTECDRQHRWPNWITCQSRWRDAVRAKRARVPQAEQTSPLRPASVVQGLGVDLTEIEGIDVPRPWSSCGDHVMSALSDGKATRSLSGRAVRNKTDKRNAARARQDRIAIALRMRPRVVKTNRLALFIGSKVDCGKGASRDSHKLQAGLPDAEILQEYVKQAWRTTSANQDQLEGRCSQGAALGYELVAEAAANRVKQRWRSSPRQAPTATLHSQSHGIPWGKGGIYQKPTNAYTLDKYLKEGLRRRHSGRFHTISKNRVKPPRTVCFLNPCFTASGSRAGAGVNLTPFRPRKCGRHTAVLIGGQGRQIPGLPPTANLVTRKWLRKPGRRGEKGKKTNLTLSVTFPP